MPEITNCMLSSYDVLPGSPRNFKFSNVGTNIGILHWDEPNERQDTIDGYRVTYTKASTIYNIKKILIKIRPRISLKNGFKKQIEQGLSS